MIIKARRTHALGESELRKLGIAYKRARYFITCNGYAAARGTRQEIAGALLDPHAFGVGVQQLSLDDFVPQALPDAAPQVHQLAEQGVPAPEAARLVREEALTCLTRRI